MRNRFMLAPLTTTQNLDDGTASEDEFRWLTAAARGGFGLTLTGVANVQEQGRGFPGQLGIFSDAHMAGLSRLAEAIKAADSLAMVQLHHAGRRSPTALIGTAPPSAPLRWKRWWRTSLPLPGGRNGPALMESRSTAPTATWSPSSSAPR
jgi:2,4-dienoyl-CoA reductase-like NADH-dependent reductase (Old Yellow Enzyme family)